MKAKIDSGEKLAWLTCYDYSFAKVIESTQLDMVLVGDSGGMVTLGYKDTTPVNMEEMIMMASAVRRGAPNKFIVGDMPKGSYEVSHEEAVSNAMRFIKEAGCDAVKLEGGNPLVASRVKSIVDSGIVVIGHLGLIPQSFAQQGGYRVIGRDKKEADQLKFELIELSNAGAFAVLLESIPQNLAFEIFQENLVITFGIGAGKFVHGQLLILHDLLGLYSDFRPKFAKCFIPQIMQSFENRLLSQPKTIFNDGVFGIAQLAIEEYINEIKNGLFPSEEFSYTKT